MKTWLIALLLCLIPTVANAQSNNAGIVRGLWYDQERFFAGDQVRIYVAIRNNTGADLSGAVEFFVNGERIERNFIDALDGRIVESWADWTASYGTSSISASLTRTEISSSASGTAAIEVVSALAQDTIFIDRDTDGDRIGNETDTDDDGDGVSDREERQRGTDPLVFDAPDTSETRAETTAENDAGEGNTTDGPTSDATPSEPTGLERYLNENRAAEALSSVTDLINATRVRLDTYRSTRDETRDLPLPTLSESTIEETTDLGTVSIDRETRETATSGVAIDGVSDAVELGSATTTDTTKTPHEGLTRDTRSTSTDVKTIVATIWSVVLVALAFGYDTLLRGLSFVLSYPMLLQIALLLLLLFLIITMARRFGGRGR